MAWPASTPATDLETAQAIGYLIAFAPPRRNFVWIHELFVDLRLRRRAVGWRLVAAMTADVGDARKQIVRVHRANVVARDFWRALDFRGRAERGRPEWMRYVRG